MRLDVNSAKISAVAPAVDRERVKALIVQAFSGLERPGHWALRGSSEGEEPNLVEQAFADKDDWRTIDPEFLDKAPDGFASALSFFSDEAFRYFLPAYLVADLDDRLELVDPVFHLTHGLEDGMRQKPIDPRRFGDRTWLDALTYRFSVFTAVEAKAILAYLEFRAQGDEFDRERISQAIAHYWGARVAHR